MCFWINVFCTGAGWDGWKFDISGAAAGAIGVNPPDGAVTQIEKWIFFRSLTQTNLNHIYLQTMVQHHQMSLIQMIPRRTNDHRQTNGRRQMSDHRRRRRRHHQ